jgi:hypothetical protein
MLAHESKLSDVRVSKYYSTHLSDVTTFLSSQYLGVIEGER